MSGLLVGVGLFLMWRAALAAVTQRQRTRYARSLSRRTFWVSEDGCSMLWNVVLQPGETPEQHLARMADFTPNYVTGSGAVPTGVERSTTEREAPNPGPEATQEEEA